MPKIIKNTNNSLTLPDDFMQRRHTPGQMEYWLDEREGDLILRPKIPDARKLYIEATTGCNLQCRTCIRNVWEDPIAPMTSATFQKIVDSLPGLPDMNRVVFTSFGEPLTHPRIIDMISSIRKLDLPVTLGSNGLLLKPEISRQLISLGVDRIMVSIDGGKPETYAGIRGAMLSEVIENLHKLNELKLQMNSLIPAIGVEFVIMKSNAGELDDLVKMANQLNVSRVLVSHVLPYTQDMCPEILYGYEPVPPLKTSSWATRLGAWVTWATIELPHSHWGAERRCRFVQDKSIVVGWDGLVSPCYALSHNYSYFAIDGVKKRVSRHHFGNVNEQSLADIWTSEDYVRFRSEVRMYHFPSCPDCDLRETCDLRQQNEGCWGNNPSCADCLWAQDIIRCP